MAWMQTAELSVSSKCRCHISGKDMQQQSRRQNLSTCSPFSFGLDST